METASSAAALLIEDVKASHDEDEGLRNSSSSSSRIAK